MSRCLVLAAVMSTALAACGGPDPTATMNGPSVALDPTKIEGCWISAGLQGDIYKFLTPVELGGLSKVNGATADQVAAFKQCAAA